MDTANTSITAEDLRRIQLESAISLLESVEDMVKNTDLMNASCTTLVNRLIEAEHIAWKARIKLTTWVRDHA